MVFFDNMLDEDALTRPMPQSCVKQLIYSLVYKLELRDRRDSWNK